MNAMPWGIPRLLVALTMLAVLLAGWGRAAAWARPRRLGDQRLSRVRSGSGGRTPMRTLPAPTTMDDDASFGAWVRRRRRALDLTQADLARLVSCATVTVRMIEADTRRPSRELAQRLADYLEIVPADHATFIACARGRRRVAALGPVAGMGSHQSSQCDRIRPSTGGWEAACRGTTDGQ